MNDLNKSDTTTKDNKFVAHIMNQKSPVDGKFSREQILTETVQSRDSASRDVLTKEKQSHEKKDDRVK